MNTFVMLGRYSSQALKTASAARTRKAEHIIGRAQGKIRAMYALVGEYDLMLIVEVPSIESAIKVSAGLTRLTGISFTSVPAISVNEFDRLITEIE